MSSAENTGIAASHLLIGLTGGIGSGKSTVATLFEQRGARIIDTDEISRGLASTGGKAIPQILDVFGSGYIDSGGALNRGKMRELVFTNITAKIELEAILHPLILEQTKQFAAAPSKSPYSVVVIPLLFESQSYQGWLHRTLAVDCPEEIQLSRTMQRSELDKTLVQSIMAQQISRSRRLALADDIIRNDRDLPSLAAQVDSLHEQYLNILIGSN
jgi:dephospho-CoA kinase